MHLRAVGRVSERKAEKRESIEKRLRPVRTGCSTGETCRRGDCEHIVGSSRGDIHRRTGKGHVEPQRGGVKASVSQNAKGEINVERTETKKQKLTE